MAPALTAIRLNLGCGAARRDGFVNVDLRPEVADVVADVRSLSLWADESVDEIHADDVLEHFPAAQTQAILREWRRVLVPGGTLTIRCPNLHALALSIVKAGNERRWPAVSCYIRNVYGGHRWGEDGALDAHHTGWVPETLATELAQAGFGVVSNDRDLNMTVVACRG